MHCIVKLDTNENEKFLKACHCKLTQCNFSIVVTSLYISCSMFITLKNWQALNSPLFSPKLTKMSDPNRIFFTTARAKLFDKTLINFQVHFLLPALNVTSMKLVADSILLVIYTCRIVIEI